MLMVYYQPQRRTDGEDHRVRGAGALGKASDARPDPARSRSSSVAEESGLILQVGEWVLREACREAASWPRPLNIGVNLSPIQFRHGDLPGLVHEVLLETGLAPGRLELEITESVLIDDFARGVSILRRLMLLGVHIAMDDFGTGYSSAVEPAGVAPDRIRSTVRLFPCLQSNRQSATIVRAVIGLGRGLDLPVIAEGVETSEQLSFLAAWRPATRCRAIWWASRCRSTPTRTRSVARRHAKRSRRSPDHFQLEHDLLRKPLSTSRDHAPGVWWRGVAARLATTLTDDSAMAAAPITGDSRMPNTG